MATATLYWAPDVWGFHKLVKFSQSSCQVGNCINQDIKAYKITGGFW